MNDTFMSSVPWFKLFLSHQVSKNMIYVEPEDKTIPASNSSDSHICIRGGQLGGRAGVKKREIVIEDICNQA
jgi:hypothetical protein